MRRSKIVKDKMEVRGGKLIAKETIKVYIPERYQNFNLCTVGSDVKSCGLVAYSDEKGNWYESFVSSMLTFTPGFIDSETIEGMDYLVLWFEPGTEICEMVGFKNDNYAFEVIKEFIDKGKVPFFYKYGNHLEVYLNFKKYSGSKLVKSPVVFEALLSKIYRQKKNYFRFYREIIKPGFKNEDESMIVGIGHNILSATTNFNRITGTYLKSNIESAMVDKDGKITSIEKIYRR